MTLSGLGDRDTTYAIAGGVVVMSTGIAGIPPDWIDWREKLPELGQIVTLSNGGVGPVPHRRSAIETEHSLVQLFMDSAHVCRFQRSLR